jgi:TetR/AcrR family transcriptional repressor of nem operon
MRYDAEHKQRTRKKLLRAAALALRGEGPDRIGVASLMSKLGLTHGGFYAHFASKDDLVAQTIDEIFDQTVKAFKKMTADLPPTEALAHYIDFYLSALHAENSATGCPLPAIAGDVSRVPSAARERFSAGTERLCEGVAELFRQLGRDEESALELATSLFAEMAGAVAIARAVETPEQARLIRTRCRNAIKTRLGLMPTR